MKKRQYARKPAPDTSVLSAGNLLQTRPFQADSINQQTPQVQKESEALTGGFDLTKQYLLNPPTTVSGQPLQAKLTIGQPNDKYEQEADRVAHNVVQQINSAQTAAASPQTLAQRQEETIQMKPLLQKKKVLEGGEASSDLESSVNQARGSGQPLDANLQRQMGQAMGADFSGVKVHTDSQADQLNQSIQAKAFTTGNDVFFRRNAYQPNDKNGQELIAHELTHVVQQNAQTIHASSIQRKLDTDTIERYKGVLGLSEVSIAEMAKGGPKATDKISTYPTTSLYNVPSDIQNKSLVNLDHLMTDEEIKTNPSYGQDYYDYFASITAYDHLQSSNGGGAFISTSKLAVICEGAPDRALLHEMGHAEQQERLGAQFGDQTSTTVNRIILEYHNVLFNENLYDFVANPDVTYDELNIRISYDKSNLNKHKDKTWKDLYSDAGEEHELNKKLLDEIKDLLDDPVFAKWGAQAEANLISEYYENTK